MMLRAPRPFASASGFRWSTAALGRGGWLAALLLFGLLPLGGCGFYLPRPDGRYRAQGHASARVPLSIRHVEVGTAEIEEADFSSDPVEVKDMNAFTAELDVSVRDHLGSRGTAQPVGDGELSYILDVEFHSLVMRTSDVNSIVSMIGYFSVGLPYVFGFPLTTLAAEGSATFSLYAADGRTKIQEFSIADERNVPVGLYYNLGIPLGKAAEYLVEEFEKQLADRAESILTEHPLAVAVAVAVAGAVATPPAPQPIAEEPIPLSGVAILDVDGKSSKLQPQKLQRLSEYLQASMAGRGRVRVVRGACGDDACIAERGESARAEKVVTFTIARAGRNCALTGVVYDVARTARERTSRIDSECSVPKLLKAAERVAHDLSSKTRP